MDATLNLWLNAEEFAVVAACAERRRLADLELSERLGRELASDAEEQGSLQAA